MRGPKADEERRPFRAAGRTLAVPEIDLCRIEDGKVIEYRVLSDEQAFAQQLGLTEEPASQPAPDA